MVVRKAATAGRSARSFWHRGGGGGGGGRGVGCSRIVVREQYRCPPTAPRRPFDSRSACLARRFGAFYAPLFCCVRAFSPCFFSDTVFEQKNENARRTARRRCGRRRAALSPRWPTFPTRIPRRGFCGWRFRRFGIIPRRSGGGECTRRPSGEHQALIYRILGILSTGRMRGEGGREGGCLP